MKTGTAGLLTLLGLLSPFALATGQEAQPGPLQKTLRDGNGEVVPYRLYLPIDYDKTTKYPLVLCLHGAGEMKSKEFEARTAGSTALLQPEMRKKYPAFILVPQTSTGWVRRIDRKGGILNPDAPENPALKLVVEALTDTMKDYSVDPDRVYVTGQSMGGVGTWDMIVRHPDLFAAAVPICGIGYPTLADKIRCPVWVFHGAKDKTVPVSASQEMVKAIRTAGGEVKYTEYPDVEHGSWGPAWQEKDLAPWLFAQQRRKK